VSRYYRIVVGPSTQPALTGEPASNNAGAVWTNLVNGKADLGAQTIELDIPVVAFDAPVGQAYVKIWGPSKAQISQAADFNGAPISIYAGMQKGLPLATAEANSGQAGLLLTGQIFQAFGNWQGINQSLDFVITVDGGATQANPAALSFLWKKGEPLAGVLKQTLQAAYPKLKVSVSISSSLVSTQDEQGVYQTIQQFASYIRGASQAIIGGNYPGVTIVLKDDVITCTDGTAGAAAGDSTTSSEPVISILTQDMIGQATWLNAFTVQFNTVMRSDISVASLITLPALAGLQAVTTPQSQSVARGKSTFTGTWTVSYVRHIGNSRAPDAQSWISTFQAYSNSAAPASLSVADTSA